MMQSRERSSTETEDSWHASGVVSLLTDFGHIDPYVGVMKGVMLARSPELRIVDLTHEIPAQDVAIGGWMLSQSWRYFPVGTVHLAVVDPGVGSLRRILVGEREGHVFLAPDNGLLELSLGAQAKVWELDCERFALPGRSSTFHGRDIFSPAASAIAGGLSPRQAAKRATPDDDWIRLGSAAASIEWDGPDRFQTPILLVDAFGNLISALDPAKEGVPMDEFELDLPGLSARTCQTYAEVSPGEVLALVDSYGHLEVAVRDGNARARLQLDRGDRLSFRRRT